MNNTQTVELYVMTPGESRVDAKATNGERFLTKEGIRQVRVSLSMILGQVSKIDLLCAPRTTVAMHVLEIVDRSLDEEDGIPFGAYDALDYKKILWSTMVQRLEELKRARSSTLGDFERLDSEHYATLRRRYGEQLVRIATEMPVSGQKTAIIVCDSPLAEMLVVERDTPLFLKAGIVKYVFGEADGHLQLVDSEIVHLGFK